MPLPKELHLTQGQLLEYGTQGYLPGTGAMSQAQDGHRKDTHWLGMLTVREIEPQLQGPVPLYHFRLHTWEGR